MKTTPLLFATHNPNKVAEIKKFINPEYSIQSLADIDWQTPIAETGNTLEENAWIKTDTLVGALGTDCFADDSGLEIETLDSQPGVYSARFSGLPVDAHRNIEKVLQLMTGKTQRQAQFRTVLALYYQGQKHTFEGIVRGKITTEKRGQGGFGYDPIFLPDGFTQTFAELSPETKNKIGHRGKALAKMIDFLHQMRNNN